MKFNKLTYVVFAVFFLITKVGVAFNLHYCHGEIASISHFLEDDNGCGMEMPAAQSLSMKNYCDDEVVLITNDDKNPLVDSFKLSPVETTALFNVAIALQLVTVPSENPIIAVPYENSSHAPPLYKLYCRLTYYS